MKKRIKTILVIILIICTIITEKEVIEHKKNYSENLITYQNLIIDMMDEETREEITDQQIMDTLEKSVQDERDLIKQTELIGMMELLLITLIIKDILKRRE